MSIIKQKVLYTYTVIETEQQDVKLVSVKQIVLEERPQYFLQRSN